MGTRKKWSRKKQEKSWSCDDPTNGTSGLKLGNQEQLVTVKAREEKRMLEDVSY